uniref:Ubiquinol-cytochrome c chaperone domain-containing protein n=1 Tax=Clastoptera arizonana TaxID=38151 RepID=A0A1B6C9K3_9HEMI
MIVMGSLNAFRLFKIFERRFPLQVNSNLVETLGFNLNINVFNKHQKPLCIYQHRQAATHTSGFVKTQPNLMKKLAKKIKEFTFLNSKLKASGYFLYETVSDQIPYEYFFKEYKMPDTFNSWFLITELHVWMLMVRCMAEDEDGRKVRNGIVESMWQDVILKAKKLGSEHTMAARQQINEMSEQFQAAILTYDEGLLSSDKVLAGAIWRRFFSKQCNDPVQVENMVKYVRQQITNLENIDKDLFYARKFTWNNLQNR